MRDRFCVEFCALVLRIQNTEYFTLSDRGRSLPDQDAIHDDPVTRVEIPQSEFVFGRYSRLDIVRLPFENNLVPFLQTHEADRNIVHRTNFQYIPLQNLEFVHEIDLTCL